MTKPQVFAERYVALWNEPDKHLRKEAIAALWQPDAAHFVGTRRVFGLDQIEARITGSHEKNVGEGGYLFRAKDDAQALQDAITFHWEMVPARGGEVVACGLEFVLVSADGRITADYQFNLAKL